MFKRPKPKTKLEIEVDKLVRSLGDYSTNSKEYGEVLERLVKLHKIRQEDKPDKVNPNTALTAAAHILGIFMILQYEHLHPISTKAMSFVPKIK
jgi:hypothetical protein